MTRRARNHDIDAWMSIRASIGVFDQLVMNLLTQGTVLVFAALGIIFGSSAKLSTSFMIMLGIGVLFGAVMIHLGVSRYTTSITVAAMAAKELEDILWKDPDAPNRISHRLSSHTLAASRKIGKLYYRVWSYSLLTLVAVMVVTLSLDSASRDREVVNASKASDDILLKQNSMKKENIEPLNSTDSTLQIKDSKSLNSRNQSGAK